MQYCVIPPRLKQAASRRYRGTNFDTGRCEDSPSSSAGHGRYQDSSYLHLESFQNHTRRINSNNLWLADRDEISDSHSRGMVQVASMRSIDHKFP